MAQSDEKHASLDLSTLSRLDERTVKLEWSMDWWDGPLNGLAVVDGEKRWFEYHSDDDDAIEFHYVLYPLSPADLCRAEAWRAVNEEWQVAWRERYSRIEHAWSDEAKQFGEDWKKALPKFESPISEPPIGWFSSGRNNAFYAIRVTAAPDTDA